MTQGIKDKVVVITGASSGLGEAAARRLAKDGAKLVLGARRLDRLQALAKELSLGDDAVVQTDVSKYDEVKRLVDHAVKAHGRIDVMINNAGLMPQSLLESLKIDEWDRMIDVNIKGVLYGIAAALPVMKAQKSGHIINVSSVAGHKVRPGSTIYSATKSAVRVISEGLRQEVKPYNIRTTIISPARSKANCPTPSPIRHRREGGSILQGDGDSGRFLREHGRVRDEPAGRRGHQRDPVPANPSGILSLSRSAVGRPSIHPQTGERPCTASVRSGSSRAIASLPALDSREPRSQKRIRILGAGQCTPWRQNRAWILAPAGLTALDEENTADWRACRPRAPCRGRGGGAASVPRLPGTGVAVYPL